MREVIDVEFKILWKAPVRLSTQDRAALAVQGPEDAIYFLSRRWPCEKGVSYVEARDKCVAAVSHRIPIEASREAFITACLDARLPMDDGRS
ncbi:MAG: DUF982 domain-containing protein [Rhizobium sp.]|nr:MAG: DUF982 domain-containing protein [Rhizobium sp.]